MKKNFKIVSVIYKAIQQITLIVQYVLLLLILCLGINS